MGNIIKNGFDFMKYANASLIRKIDDIPELKHRLITLSETKSHRELSRYALLLGEHILELGAVGRRPEIDACYAVVARWQRGEARFQEALEVAGQINALARVEKDPVQAKALRAFGQIAATPHVRWHALVASEYTVVVTNLLYPGDFAKAREERELQIALMQEVQDGPA